MRSLQQALAEPRWWRRAIDGAALISVYFAVFTLLLAIIAFVGGRFQRYHGHNEWDMWLSAVFYPIGIALGGAIAAAVGPLVRRTWQGALLGVATVYPVFALLSMAVEPHGPHAYQIRWFFATICAVPLGGFTGVLIFRQG